MDALADQPLLMCLIIFLARVADVSLGTVRMIMVIRGHRWLAAGVGLAETLIWLIAAAQVIRNLDQWYYALAFAGGFAAGNAAGVWLEGRLALGLQLVRTMSSDFAVDVGATLRDRGYDVVDVPGRGRRREPVEVLFVVEKRRNIPRLLAEIAALDPLAVSTVTDIKGQHDPMGLPAQSAWVRFWRRSLHK